MKVLLTSLILQCLNQFVWLDHRLVFLGVMHYYMFGLFFESIFSVSVSDAMKN